MLIFPAYRFHVTWRFIIHSIRVILAILSTEWHHREHSYGIIQERLDVTYKKVFQLSKYQWHFQWLLNYEKGRKELTYCYVMSSVPDRGMSRPVIPFQLTQIGGYLDSLIEQINGRLTLSIGAGSPLRINQAPLLRSTPSSFLIRKCGLVHCKRKHDMLWDSSFVRETVALGLCMHNLWGIHDVTPETDREQGREEERPYRLHDQICRAWGCYSALWGGWKQGKENGRMRTRIDLFYCCPLFD